MAPNFYMTENQSNVIVILNETVKTGSNMRWKSDLASPGSSRQIGTRFGFWISDFGLPANNLYLL